MNYLILFFFMFVTKNIIRFITYIDFVYFDLSLKIYDISISRTDDIRRNYITYFI